MGVNIITFWFQPVWGLPAVVNTQLTSPTW